MQCMSTLECGMQVIERDRDVGLQGGSVYVGRAGIALTYLRLAQALRRGSVSPPVGAGGIPTTPEARLCGDIAISTSKIKCLC